MLVEGWTSWACTARCRRDGSGTIDAGTSQIQRNILAEKVLGLPREPRPDHTAVIAGPPLWHRR
ncbi:hypothetical protein SNL152K_9815 [Streptomyces sp. NL15-2K]|nr:hypothetical protein SNL152K_9815 [Streptomyces sp. NL15-2K]